MSTIHSSPHTQYHLPSFVMHTRHLHLSVVCDATAWGEQVAVLGSWNCWDHNNATKLITSRTDYPRWSVQLQLPYIPDLTHVEYKYLIVCDNHIRRWEAPFATKNRIIFLMPNTIVLSNDIFNHIPPSPPPLPARSLITPLPIHTDHILCPSTSAPDNLYPTRQALILTLLYITTLSRSSTPPIHYSRRRTPISKPVPHRLVSQSSTSSHLSHVLHHSSTTQLPASYPYPSHLSSTLKHTSHPSSHLVSCFVLASLFLLLFACARVLMACPCL